MPMPHIPEINRTSLWIAWKVVRKQLPRASIRDVTDYVEFDIDPYSWIDRLLKNIEDDSYQPGQPYRYTLPKNLGLSRKMTFPRIPDLVLYHAITNYIYAQGKHREQKHVYFARNALAKRRKALQKSTDVDRDVDRVESDYTFTSGTVFAMWLNFHQYRKQLLQEEVHPFIVVTDINTFFDSILYDRVVDVIHAVAINPDLMGLLFFLLERLSARGAYTESPRIGLPVDEFDCSRTLAHMVLFPHDRQMAKHVGAGAYVRWMDDQNFGVASYSAGLKVLRHCDASLARLHLAPNTAKTRILSLAEASKHFHLEMNEKLDEIELLSRENPADRALIGKRIEELWARARQSEEIGGEWGKVLKRFYRFAGIGGRSFLRSRARKDVLDNPTMAIRIIEYMRVTSDARTFVDLAKSLWSHSRQVYPDINRALMEAFLRVETSPKDALLFRDLASDMLEGRYKMPGAAGCAAIAPLVIMRFGDRRSLPRLRKLVQRSLEDLNPAAGKAVTAVYASFGKSEYSEVVQAASKLSDNYLAYFLRLLDGLKRYEEVPKRFKVRRELVYDSVAAQYRVDMRKILSLKLLKLNDRAAISAWLKDARRYMMGKKMSDVDRKLVMRILG